MTEQANNGLHIKELNVEGYEKVIEATNSKVNLHCIIAMHSTKLGPSLGGVRLRPYSSQREALGDVLRLSKAMTYKSALVEDGLGGGKSVIIADPKDKTEALLLAFGQVIDHLGGDYIAAEDVGTSPSDMEVIRRATPYVAALQNELSSGDPSRYTAWGVFRGLQAIAFALWGNKSLKNRSIAIQGLGSVGSKLADLLFWEGAELILTDLDEAKLKQKKILYGAKVIPPEEFCSIDCDILSPCALGGVFNDTTINQVRCRAIGGAANNQLATPMHGEKLMEKNILYAPDYVINAGGIINAAAEFETGGYKPKKSRDKVEQIYDILINIFKEAQNRHLPPSTIADEMAEYKLAHLIGKRLNPINWSHYRKKV